MVKPTETESGMEVARGLGNDCLMGTEFPFRKMDSPERWMARMATHHCGYT